MPPSGLLPLLDRSRSLLHRLQQTDDLAARPTRSSLPAVVFVVIYVFLLFCIPSRLIVGPLGSPGTPANLWGVLALFWWVCSLLSGTNRRRGMTPTRVTWVLLALSVVLSFSAGMTNGWYAPVDMHQVTDEVYSLSTTSVSVLNDKMISAAGRGLIAFAGWSGILLLAADGLRSWREIELVGTWIVRFGVGVGVLGIVQFFTSFDLASYFVIPGLRANAEFGAVDTRSVLNRVAATALHPIEFGVVMSVALVVALHRALFARPSLTRWLPLAILSVAMPMSVSRSAILATAVAGTVMFLSWPKIWRIHGLVIVPVALVGLRLLVPGLVGTIRSLFTNISNDPSVTGRTDDYAAIFGIIADHPLLGRGLYTFVPQYYRILDNQLLMIFIELGVVGLVAASSVMIAGFLAARGAALRTTDPRAKHLAVTLSGAIAGIVLSYATFDAWGFPMVAGLTFLLLGLAGAAWQIARDEHGEAEILGFGAMLTMIRERS